MNLPPNATSTWTDPGVPPPTWRGRVKNASRWAQERRNMLFFLGGFLFDAFTTRVDSWIDIGIQFFYLVSLTLILLYQHKEALGRWAAAGRSAKWWKYNVEVLHFLYGGLLSAYVVVYFKSTSGFKTLMFFAFLFVMLITNEMPQLRRMGTRLRLGLYTFCIATFLLYMVPVLVGRMNSWTFVFSMIAAAAAAWGVAGLLGRQEGGGRRAQIRLFWPGGAVLVILGLLNHYRLIPPVPLSVAGVGVYHQIERLDGDFIGRMPKPPVWAFWRKDSRPFLARPGDQIYCLFRIYAPSRFRHTVMVRWEYLDALAGAYRTTDRMALPISGGRAQGFRGVGAKGNFQPGRWRVTAETQDGRAIGRVKFRVAMDPDTGERQWVEKKL